MVLHTKLIAVRVATSHSNNRIGGRRTYLVNYATRDAMYAGHSPTI
jgi:hypothetical protein